jgi:hypothetical protein
MEGWCPDRCEDLLIVKNWKMWALDRKKWRHIIGRPRPVGCSTIREREILQYL